MDCIELENTDTDALRRDSAVYEPGGEEKGAGAKGSAGAVEPAVGGRLELPVRSRGRVGPVMGERGVPMLAVLRERVRTGGRERVGGGLGAGAKRISLSSEKMLGDLLMSAIGKPAVRSASSALASAMLRKARVPKATMKTVAMGCVQSASGLDGGEMICMRNAVAAVSVVPRRYNKLAR